LNSIKKAAYSGFFYGDTFVEIKAVLT